MSACTAKQVYVIPNDLDLETLQSNPSYRPEIKESSRLQTGFVTKNKHWFDWFRVFFQNLTLMGRRVVRERQLEGRDRDKMCQDGFGWLTIVIF